MAADRLTTSVIEFPNDLEVVLYRDFAAPIDLVFDVLTKPEHLIKTIAPFGEEVTLMEFDYRVGGDYHFIFVPPGGPECSFRGTYLEWNPPFRTVQTWIFDGWPEVEAIESIDLDEADCITHITHRLAFRNEAERARLQKMDGFEANYDLIAAVVADLVAEQDATT